MDVMRKARTIGQLAKEVGVGVETIRFYERRGLIKQPRKTEGPRHYDDRTVASLRYLRLAQRLGFTLKEIQTLQGRLTSKKMFCSSSRSMVEDKLVSLQREAETIAQLKQELTAFLMRCRSRDPNAACPIVEELADLDSAVVTAAEPGQR
jgi:MerR family mercuric resistance operon transcriptional regulator